MRHLMLTADTVWVAHCVVSAKMPPNSLPGDSVPFPVVAAGLAPGRDWVRQVVDQVMDSARFVPHARCQEPDTAHQFDRIGIGLRDVLAGGRGALMSIWPLQGCVRLSGDDALEGAWTSPDDRQTLWVLARQALPGDSLLRKPGPTRWTALAHRARTGRLQEWVYIERLPEILEQVPPSTRAGALRRTRAAR